VDVVVAGQGHLAASLIEGVRRSGHRLAGVWLDPHAHRAAVPRRLARGAPVGELPALPPACDVLLVGDLGCVLGPEVRGVARVAAVNAHWSLLPRHRGPAPAAAAILAGDERSGVTFHTLTDEVDRGLCLDQADLRLRPDETRTSLYRRAAELAGTRVPGLFQRLETTGPTGEPLGEGSWFAALRPADTRLRWEQPAEALHRLVRAATRPAAWFVCGKRGVRVSQASFDAAPVDAAPGTVVPGRGVSVATGSGVLRIERAWVPRGPLCWPWPGLRRPVVGRRLG
jgi:methionyl-tRNA formyltransferase